MHFCRLSLRREGVLGIGRLVVLLFRRCITRYTIDDIGWGKGNSSSPPSHVKNSIPYSQFRRLRSLCSKDSDFSLKSEEMCDVFDKRGYPASVVQAGHLRAQQIDRQSALQTSRTWRKRYLLRKCDRWPAAECKTAGRSGEGRGVEWERFQAHYQNSFGNIRTWALKYHN